MLESRQQRVLRLVTFDPSAYNSRWYGLQIEGRASWQWGKDLNDPLMRKCMVIRRNPDGELQIDKWIFRQHKTMNAKTPFSTRWQTMGPSFTKLFEIVVWPYV